MPRRYASGLAAVRSIKDHQKRGYALQGFVADIFRGVGFDVTPNAGAARPRQTDLVARKGDEAYLIETKWEDRKAGTPEIAELYDRLRRTSSDLVGVLFAFGGFTDEAIAEVSNERKRPVLLFDAEAIEEVDAGPREILRLIDLKKTRLIDQGDVHAGGSGKARLHNRGLPGSSARFVYPDGATSPVYVAGGGYNKLVFATNIVDVDWTTSLGRGVALDLRLGGLSVQDLVAVFKDLLEIGWTSRPSYNSERAARWSIQQAETNWHGEGTKEFISTLKSWRERYKGIEDKRLHHTEEFVYIDKCEYGFFTLTGDVSADPRRFIWHAVISFQLFGIPLDHEMVRRLARRFDDQAFFRPLDRAATRYRHLRDEAPKRITPLCLVVEELDREDWVVGIVIKNFYRSKRRGTSPEEDETLPWNINESDVLICDLAEWHTVNGPKRSYYLQNLEWTVTSEAVVIRPVANWRDARRRRGRADVQPLSITTETSSS